MRECSVGSQDGGDCHMMKEWSDWACIHWNLGDLIETYKIMKGLDTLGAEPCSRCWRNPESGATV